jgi:nucleotide-binding universal stress UspA family protein
MKTDRILLPIDTRKCPLEVLALVNGLAAHRDISVTLLNVVTLNILAPETRLYDELAAESRFHLECIAEQYLPAAVSKTVRVRFGKPAEELLKQSREEPVDLIVLPNNGCSFLRRMISRGKCAFNPSIWPLIKRLARQSADDVVVVSSKSHFDCEKIWGRPRQNFTRDQPLAHLMRLPKPAKRAFSQAEGLGETFLSQKHVRTTAVARDASPHKRPTARGLFRFKLS